MAASAVDNTLRARALIKRRPKLWKLINSGRVSKVSTLRRIMGASLLFQPPRAKKMSVRRTNKGWAKFGPSKVYWIFVLFIGILERIRTGEILPLKFRPSLPSLDRIILLLSLIHWSRHKFLIKAFSLSEVGRKDTNWQNEKLFRSIEVPMFCLDQKTQKKFLLISNFRRHPFIRSEVKTCRRHVIGEINVAGGWKNNGFWFIEWTKNVTWQPKTRTKKNWCEKSLFISRQTTGGRGKLPIGSGMDGKNINKLAQLLHVIDYPFEATSNAAFAISRHTLENLSHFKNHLSRDNLLIKKALCVLGVCQSRKCITVGGKHRDGWAWINDWRACYKQKQVQMR